MIRAPSAGGDEPLEILQTQVNVLHQPNYRTLVQESREDMKDTKAMVFIYFSIKGPGKAKRHF